MELNEILAVTSATRPAAVVFDVYLSARSRFTGIDPDTSGPAVRPCV